MTSAIEFNKLFISMPHGAESDYESVEVFEEFHPYIKWMRIDFVLESDDGGDDILIYGEKEKAKPVASLFGALIFGAQAYRDGQDFLVLCDDHSAELCVVATDLDNEDLLEDFDGQYHDVFYVYSLELSSELVEAPNLRRFFERLPRFVLQYAGVEPQLWCNLIADNDEFYERQKKETKYDPRSAGKESIQLFLDNGYRLTDSGKLLFRLFDDYDDMDDIDFDDENLSCRCEASQGDLGISEDDLLGKEDQLDARIPFHDRSLFSEIQSDADYELLEDHVQIGFGPYSAHIPRTAPRKLVDYVGSAIAAYCLGSTFDYTLKQIADDDEPDVPDIFLAFQKMYFAGKDHMNATMQRMEPHGKPSAGELFADVALSRARNTYYVAGLLYREGHMIEGHAMSRLMLEQIAWAFNVCEKKDVEEAKKISPTKAISKLKKKIEPVGKLYGILSTYVHLPLMAHYGFVDFSSGQGATLCQFGVHSYYYGQIIACLADYWAAVYEYTQARHFDSLDNWIDDSSGLVLNPSRPFLPVIDPICEELTDIYSKKYVSYEEFLRANWTPRGENKVSRSEPEYQEE